MYLFLFYVCECVALRVCKCTAFVAGAQEEQKRKSESWNWNHRGLQAAIERCITKAAPLQGQQVCALNQSHPSSSLSWCLKNIPLCVVMTVASSSYGVCLHVFLSLNVFLMKCLSGEHCCLTQRLHLIVFCNLNTWQVDEELGVQDHPQLLNELENTLGCMRPQLCYFVIFFPLSILSLETYGWMYKMIHIYTETFVHMNNM